MNKGDATRQKIIERAAPVFNQRGFAGASMQDIMQATGLGKGGLYRHFSCKQELAAESFRYALAQAVEVRTGHLTQIESPVEQLRQMIQAFAERPSPVPGGCPLMNTGVDADDTNTELRALACDGLRAWKARITTIVESGIGSGEICRTAEPPLIANLIVSTLEGALLVSRLERTKDALRDARTALNQLIETVRLRPPA